MTMLEHHYRDVCSTIVLRSSTTLNLCEIRARAWDAGVQFQFISVQPTRIAMEELVRTGLIVATGRGYRRRQTTHNPEKPIIPLLEA